MGDLCETNSSILGEDGKMCGAIQAIGGAYFLVLLLFVCYVKAKKGGENHE